MSTKCTVTASHDCVRLWQTSTCGVSLYAAYRPALALRPFRQHHTHHPAQGHRPHFPCLLRALCLPASPIMCFHVLPCMAASRASFRTGPQAALPLPTARPLLACICYHVLPRSPLQGSITHIIPHRATGRTSTAYCTPFACLHMLPCASTFSLAGQHNAHHPAQGHRSHFHCLLHALCLPAYVTMCFHVLACRAASRASSRTGQRAAPTILGRQ
jgi:hypothetical protein